MLCYVTLSSSVTVTESCPRCTQSSSHASWGDSITLECSVNYNGTAVPVLQWSPPSSGSGAVTTDCSTSGRVCSSVSVDVTQAMTTVESRSCSLTTIRDQCSRWNSQQIIVTCTYSVIYQYMSVVF